MVPVPFCRYVRKVKYVPYPSQPSLIVCKIHTLHTSTYIACATVVERKLHRIGYKNDLIHNTQCK